ncbi:MAG: type II toxin-antitoxin system VapC family toxin [Candidatus Acidiferrales bacterium]
MRTALDTNVLSALWSNELIAAKVAVALGNARQDGSLIVSAPVYAESLAHPTFPASSIDAFLSETGISVDFDITREAWLQAGRRYSKYASRRRRTAQESKRLLADFIIGAHALVQADRFMTLDPGRYKLNFPELKLL